MSTQKRRFRLVLLLAVIAVGAAVVRSRQRVEVWHVAADPE